VVELDCAGTPLTTYSQYSSFCNSALSGVQRVLRTCVFLNDRSKISLYTLICDNSREPLSRASISNEGEDSPVKPCDRCHAVREKGYKNHRRNICERHCQPWATCYTLEMSEAICSYPCNIHACFQRPWIQSTVSSRTRLDRFLLSEQHLKPSANNRVLACQLKWYISVNEAHMIEE
jgi:hypothetical protein